jgi:hypothetical protein
MNEPTAKAMIVELDEVHALREAERVLQEVQMAFGTQSTLQSLETSEIITGEEIARARAILDFIANYRMVKVI